MSRKNTYNNQCKATSEKTKEYTLVKDVTKLPTASQKTVIEKVKEIDEFITKVLDWPWIKDYYKINEKNETTSYVYLELQRERREYNSKDVKYKVYKLLIDKIHDTTEDYLEAGIQEYPLVMYNKIYFIKNDLSIDIEVENEKFELNYEKYEKEKKDTK